MSSSADTAQIVAIYDSFQKGRMSIDTHIALVLYDYFLTFDLEVELFWRHKLTGASVLFALNSCNRIVKSTQIIGYLIYIPWANTDRQDYSAFSAMRGFALTRNRGIAAVIFTLSIAPIGVNVAQLVSGISSAPWPVIGCVSTFSATPQEVIIVPIVSRGGVIIADFILVVATWRTLGTSVVHASITKISRGSLAAIMLWNGSLYFGVLLVLNILHMTLSLTSALGNPLSFMTALTEPLTSILVSRFLLDLQKENQRDVKLDSDDPLHFSESRSSGSLNFARAMGSISETLVPDAAREDGEVDEGEEDEDSGVPELQQVDAESAGVVDEEIQEVSRLQ
ncbi:hypothetical protein L226DRAFT_561756 [Lentinus tigrinus ALCF2SS1-7]|uniref:uncharacterized protein n=1 Tax=Lentinus tigrinus ALCF2SS1-7 TaxID=1328758 RepID=UPI0011662652|nr:hypothetical protein L226DRAFT_561756 [Lentinus tigrinus ALCF2SS1-7]